MSCFSHLQNWPTICLVFMQTGCVIEPVELVADNLPPEIINATSFNQCMANPECTDEGIGNVITTCDNCSLTADLVASNGLVFAMVEDDSPEELDYRWTLSDSGWLTSAISDEIGSQVVINDIAAVDGEILTLQILDGSDYQVQMGWILD